MENKDINLFDYTLDLIKDVEGDEILKKILHIFAMILYQNFDEKTLSNFNNNVKTLKMKFVDSCENANNAIAYYNNETNEIAISKHIQPYDIFHELFHMASRKRNGNNIYSGLEFITLDDLGNMGNTLTEGYTDKMTKKYIPEYNPQYIYEMLISNALDKIIGEKNMEKIYLTGNTDLLYNILAKYLGDKDFCRFMYLSESLKTSAIVPPIFYNNIDDQKRIKNTMRKVYELLLKLFANIYKQDDNFEEKYDDFKIYLDSLSTDLDAIVTTINFSLKDFSITYKKDKDKGVI